MHTKELLNCGQQVTTAASFISRLAMSYSRTQILIHTHTDTHTYTHTHAQRVLNVNHSS